MSFSTRKFEFMTSYIFHLTYSHPHSLVILDELLHYHLLEALSAVCVGGCVYMCGVYVCVCVCACMCGGGMNWETGIDIYTLICIKWITNKNLLYKKNKIKFKKKSKNC